MLILHRQHTFDTMVAMHDMLEQTAEPGTPLQLRHLPHSTGFKFDSCGLFDKALRNQIRMPYASYGDWMHILFAHGGMGQFSINQLVLAIEEKCNLDAADIDQYVHLIRLPKHKCPLRRKAPTLPLMFAVPPLKTSPRRVLYFSVFRN